MIRILAIGNSFSVDATTYLYQLATAAGVETKIVNLYIGGCPLEKHWQNIEKKTEMYQYQLNGVLEDRFVTIEEALAEEDWDYIVTQQASHDSGWRDTYEPFLGLIVSYLRGRAPRAKLFLQETWAYEVDSDHWAFARYERDQQKMYEKLSSCYKEMAQKYGMELLPCGDVIQKVRTLPPFCVQTGGLSLCRDGFHMSLVYGRYLLACVWAKKMLGISMKDLAYVPAAAEEGGPEPGAEEKAASVQSIATSAQAAASVDESLLALIRDAVDGFEM